MRSISINEDPAVHAVNIGSRAKSNAPSRSSNRHQSRIKQHDFKKKDNKCMTCGYDRDHARCPAKDSKCNYCRKKGHFAAMRRRKVSAHMVEEMCGSEESDDDGAHIINTVTEAGNHDWWECIEVDGFHSHRYANRHRRHKICVAVRSVQIYALRYTNKEDRSQIQVVHTSPNQSGRLRHTPLRLQEQVRGCPVLRGSCRSKAVVVRASQRTARPD